MKTFGVPQSGKRGNVVAFKSRFGQCERQHVLPRQNFTAAQRRSQSDFGGASLLWSNLTDEEAAAWCATARKTHSRRRGGQSGPLTGQMLFIQINRNQALLGLPPFRSPPEPPVFGPYEVARLRFVLRQGILALKLTVSKASGGHTLVFASPPFNSGRRYCDKFRYLGALPAAVDGESDITNWYGSRHECPQPGSRVFIRLVQQINGWRGIPQMTSAVVPALDEPAAQARRR